MVKRKVKKADDKDIVQGPVTYPIVKCFLAKNQPRVTVTIADDCEFTLSGHETESLIARMQNAIDKANELKTLLSQVDEIECYLDSMSGAIDDFREELREIDDLTEDKVHDDALDIDNLYSNLQSDARDLLDTVE